MFDSPLQLIVLQIGQSSRNPLKTQNKQGSKNRAGIDLSRYKPKPALTITESFSNSTKPQHNPLHEVQVPPWTPATDGFFCFAPAEGKTAKKGKLNPQQSKPRHLFQWTETLISNMLLYSVRNLDVAPYFCRSCCTFGFFQWRIKILNLDLQVLYTFHLIWAI